MMMAIDEAKVMEQQQREKPRARPTLELYKPPVLRGDQPTIQQKKIRIEKGEKIKCREAKELAAAAPNWPQSAEKTRQEHFPTKAEASFAAVEDDIREEEEDHPPIFEEVVAELKKQLDRGDATKCGQFLAHRIVPFRELAQQIGEFLAKHIIEDSGQKQAKRGILTRTFMSIAGTPVAAAFCHGVVRALRRYFDCRDGLRGNDQYLPVWLNFVALTYELGQIAQEENVVQLIFDLFEYLLTEPVVNSLKIAELESSLSALMIMGRRLELEYPAQLGELKTLIRDAFLSAIEPWARKMLMLMVELGAAEWRISGDLEEYYFG